jgi:hypothetical protein
MMRNERGVVLGLIIITSVIFGIAAFGILLLAMSRLRQSKYLGEDRLRAGYAAEAGLVMAMQELWVDPADCAFGPYTITDGTNNTTVTVTATPCPGGAASKLQAKVTW